MSKYGIISLTLLAATIAIALPIYLSLYIARQQALNAEFELALSYARDVLNRSEATADQIDSGFRDLTAAREENPDPCNPLNLAIMQRIDVASSYIQAIGYMSGNIMECSSLSIVGGIDLGPIDQVQESGVMLRNDVVMPFSQGIGFLVVERDNYAAIIHKSLPIDITTTVENISLATLTDAALRILTARGNINPAWVDALVGAREATFIEGDQIVAVIASDRYFIGAIAAVPLERLEAGVREIAWIIVPVGVASGLILAIAVLYLARTQLALPAVIKAALRRKQFFLEYQPVVDIKSGKWIGAEALIRWRHDNGEMVRPDLFIPVAEDSRLIMQITNRVLELVEEDAGDIFRQHPYFHIAINLSAMDMQSPNLVARLKSLSGIVSASPGNFITEATERGLMAGDVVREVIRELRSSGFSIAIDDFGTGYSSLSYLETFEIDYLKIDKSFVDTIGIATATSHVVPHIIEMAKDLNLDMIAEGVETEVQATYLFERGVQFAQGWFYARPMRMEKLREGLLTKGVTQGTITKALRKT